MVWKKQRNMQIKSKGEFLTVSLLEEKGYEVITPFDACSEPDKPYSYYMGESVKALLECDAVYFVFDWATSKGCMAEFEIARVYGKQIMM
jgi:hypothetical protein